MNNYIFIVFLINIMHVSAMEVKESNGKLILLIHRWFNKEKNEENKLRKLEIDTYKSLEKISKNQEKKHKKAKLEESNRQLEELTREGNQHLSGNLFLEPIKKDNIVKLSDTIRVLSTAEFIRCNMCHDNNLFKKPSTENNNNSIVEHLSKEHKLSLDEIKELFNQLANKNYQFIGPHEEKTPKKRKRKKK